MNKTDMINAMAAKTGLSKKDSEASLNAFIEVVTDGIAKGEKIQLVGFGTFEVSERSARTGRNPQTGKEITIPAKMSPRFKAGAVLKKAAESVK